ncbi:hypothetical protein Pint_20199 [Pistacia integerrima]|uniref:Uncharacterized protein n=1 Tax=Pistacia integerrima TaxID=434235 RepID=A0ACC0XCW6_9ROSI|nr:hypothetical protein Pint_20199 [Pistacia integerrima]
MLRLHQNFAVASLKQTLFALEKEQQWHRVVQGLESDGLRDHLAVLAESLNRVRAMIYPPADKASKLGELLPGLGEIVDKEHKRLLARKSIIEKRKEEHERQLIEMKRLAAEYEQGKNQRILREIKECELEEAQAPLEEAEKRSKKKGGKEPIMEGEKVTKQTLMERALIEQLRERQEVD